MFSWGSFLTNERLLNLFVFNASVAHAGFPKPLRSYETVSLVSIAIAQVAHNSFAIRKERRCTSAVKEDDVSAPFEITLPDKID